MHEPSPILSIPSHTARQIRSSSCIVSIGSAIDELVANSIDADSTHIELVMDADTMVCTVYDDGIGMSRDDLELFGIHLSSSKLSSGGLESLSVASAHSHGFRGEAANAIGTLCKMEIETRQRRRDDSEKDERNKRPRTNNLTSAIDSGVTLMKTILHGVGKAIGFASTHRIECGTTITVYDIYGTTPVRRQMLLQDEERDREIDRIRRGFMRLAMIHPRIEFAIYDARLDKRKRSPVIKMGTLPSSPTGRSVHLPIVDSQRVWYKPAVSSLLENFQIIAGFDKTLVRGSPYITSSPRKSLDVDALYELQQFQPPCTFRAAAPYMSSMYVSGFLSHPSRVLLHSRDHQMIYLNRHAISCKPLTQSLDAMYDRLLECMTPIADGNTVASPLITANRSPVGNALHKGSIKAKPSPGCTIPSPAKQGRRRYSAYLLHLEMPGDHYDLLFDPDKHSVEFKCIWAVTEGLVQELKKWLERQIQTSTKQERQNASYEVQSPSIRSSVSPSLQRLTHASPRILRTPQQNSPQISASSRCTIGSPSAWHTIQAHPSPTHPPFQSPTSKTPLLHSFSPSTVSAPPFGHAFQLDRSAMSSPELIGQLENRIILARVGDVILAMDQHAADERQRLEYLERNLEQQIVKKNLTQLLPMQLSSNEADTIRSHLPRLQSLGYDFRFSISDPGLVSLKCVPVVCGVELDVDDLREFLSQLGDLPTSASASRIRPRAVQRVLNYKSCRSSVMFGDALDETTMETILSGVLRCDFPFNCAHGRPTMSPLARLADHTPDTRMSDGSSVDWTPSQLITLKHWLSPATAARS